MVGGGEGKALSRLHLRLGRLDPNPEHEDQLEAVENLGRFVIAGPSIPTVGHEGIARLQLLVEVLERVESVRLRFQATLHAVLSHTRGIKMFGEVGMPNDRGLLAETSDRLARKFLPEAPAPHELWMLASKIIRNVSDLNFLGPAADPLPISVTQSPETSNDPVNVTILPGAGRLLGGS